MSELLKVPVALRRCTGYEPHLVDEKIAELMALVPPPDCTGKVVLIKPNIVSAKEPEKAVCTHPAVVAALVRAFVSRGAARVIVGESPGGVMTGTAAAKKTGMYDAVVAAGGTWVEFDNAIDVSVPNGKIVKTVQFAKVFADADIIVSAAKLKTHQLMAYTGAMKNLFGLIIGLQKARCHYRFPQKETFAAFLNDVVTAAKPMYGVVDAITAMDGPGGPNNGSPCQMNVLAASTDLLALDSVCASLAGYNPRSVANLADAYTRGLWVTSPECAEVVGDSFDDCRCRTFRIVRNAGSTQLLRSMPHFVQSFVRFVFSKYPHFKNHVCIRCGKCREICPASALSFVPMGGKHARDTQVGDTATKTGNTWRVRISFDKSKCIQCYCCHEMCPVNAIRLRRL